MIRVRHTPAILNTLNVRGAGSCLAKGCCPRDGAQARRLSRAKNKSHVTSLNILNVRASELILGQRELQSRPD